MLSNLTNNFFASSCDSRRPIISFGTRHLRSSSWQSVNVPRFRLDLARTGYTPIEECIEERYMSKYLLALPVALSVAAVASQVSARDGAGRDAAMRRCIKVAYVQYHDQSQHLYRAEVYMACMVAAGYKP